MTGDGDPFFFSNFCSISSDTGIFNDSSWATTTTTGKAPSYYGAGVTHTSRAFFSLSWLQSQHSEELSDIMVSATLIHLSSGAKDIKREHPVELRGACFGCSMAKAESRVSSFTSSFSLKSFLGVRPSPSVAMKPLLLILEQALPCL